MGVVRYGGLPFVARFRWNVGKVMEKFYQSFKDRKIVAARCKKCGYVVVPPRVVCPKCSARLGEENLIELDGRGKVESYTAVRFRLDGKGGYIWLDEPQFLAAIRLNGVDSLIFARVDGEPSIGAEVEPVWAEKCEGKPSDLIGFRVIA